MRANKVFSITKKSPNYVALHPHLTPFHTQKILGAAQEGKTSTAFCHKTISPEAIVLLQKLGYLVTYIKKPKWWGLASKFIINVSWDVGL